jgi:hypothetical protein
MQLGARGRLSGQEIRFGIWVRDGLSCYIGDRVVRVVGIGAVSLAPLVFVLRALVWPFKYGDTITFIVSFVQGRCGDKTVVDNRKYTFALNPLPLLIFQAARINKS